MKNFRVTGDINNLDDITSVEMDMILEARDALRAGDKDRALSLLERALARPDRCQTNKHGIWKLEFARRQTTRFHLFRTEDYFKAISRRNTGSWNQ